MPKDFNLKRLKKIAKKEKLAEEKNEMDKAKAIVKKHEDILVEEINRFIIDGFKKKSNIVRIDLSKIECLNKEKGLTSNGYFLITKCILDLYKSKGFPVYMNEYSKDSFYIFSSKRAKLSWKYLLF